MTVRLPAGLARDLDLRAGNIVTTKPNGHAFEVPLPTGCGAKGSVMVHQLKSLDWLARRAKKIGAAPSSVTEATSEIVTDIVV